MPAKKNINTSELDSRLRFFVMVLALLFSGIIIRLSYWQIFKGKSLALEAYNQYQKTITKTGNRGSILTSDRYALVTNQTVYRLFANPDKLEQKPEVVSQLLTPILLSEIYEYQIATDSAEKKILSEELNDILADKLEKKSKWVNLKESISLSSKESIEKLDIPGLGFEAHFTRFYPEASLAAQVTGFVGKDTHGNDTGYFGIEGALDQELKARKVENTITDIATHITQTTPESLAVHGRTIVTTIRRDIQHTAEQLLKEGLEEYGAESGEVIIVHPKTGAILALAALPTYEQSSFFAYDSNLYKNPSLSELYEPGSTFKVLTVASGIDAGVITPETQCPVCHQARRFGQYTIKTWNDVYTPNITMTDALAKSDNTAMIFIAEKLGSEMFKEYLKKFGIGSALHIELQGDIDTPFPTKWGPVELATISFGQGVSVSSLQMVRALTAIANEGNMMQLRILEAVIDPITLEETPTHAEVAKTVISKNTAAQVTKMMVAAAQHGEAQWIASKTHTVAGKTGTSSVAVEGGYAEDETIASFIGFAPPDDPQFLMLVKLNKPQSSPWASETAAPLWYDIAEKLYLYLGIPGDK